MMICVLKNDFQLDVSAKLFLIETTTIEWIIVSVLSIFSKRIFEELVLN